MIEKQALDILSQSGSEVVTTAKPSSMDSKIQQLGTLPFDRKRLGHLTSCLHVMGTQVSPVELNLTKLHPV